nr:trichohyalin-like [Paramormyrops kingsleyae]
MASRKWSAVWLYYQDGKDAKKVVCLICLETIQHHGNTSNMRRHLRLKHHAEYADLQAKKRRDEVAGGIRKQPVPGVQCGHYSESSDSAVGGGTTVQRVLKREEFNDTAGGIGDEALSPFSVNQHPREYSDVESRATGQSPEQRVAGPTMYCALGRPSLQEEAGRSTGGNADVMKVITVGQSEQEQIRRALEQEARALQRERELTEQLRRAQEQEARALEQQRELTEQLRRAQEQDMKRTRDQEAQAFQQEKELMEQLRRIQEQEARALEQQRELTEQLRRAQEQDMKRTRDQEAQAFQQEKELMEQLRRDQEQEMKRARDQEAQALDRERQAIEQLRRAQEQEGRAIEREREALEQLRRELGGRDSRRQEELERHSASFFTSSPYAVSLSLDGSTEDLEV